MKEEFTTKEQELAKHLEEAKKPKYIDKLELNDGEVYLGNLPDEDKYQVLTRHLSLLERYITAGNNQQTLLLTNIYILLSKIAEKEGIDIKEVDRQ